MDHFVWGEVSRELPCGSKKGIEIISYQEYTSIIIDSYDVERAHIVSFKVGQKTGGRLENLVFLELLRRNKEIYYYKTTGNLEVDFVVKENERITQFIQVSAGIDDEKTKAREIRALIKAGNEIPHAGGVALVLLVPDINEIVQHN